MGIWGNNKLIVFVREYVSQKNRIEMTVNQ